ncbi:hypothetical protein [Flavobacterium restrictum]|uniref:Uncharacterized protein n=1 Tax=Flavobacterium restrictum TaxID=2594428 RepID=A0A553E4B9_9FLAO|nr:hypothetical protein [Flavobacterium restrictum]TRX39763.1 hypothetical protein FNW21_08645 [Flavobacterium restrictum]
MKYILVLILLVVFAFKGQAQSEFSSKFKPIAPTKFPTKPKKTIPPPADLPKIVTPNVFKSPDAKTPSSSFSIGEPTPISMIPKPNEFMNPGDVYKDKMEKELNKTLVDNGLKEDSRLLVKIDVNFGEFRTKSQFLVIKYRDFGEIDGDLVKATLNQRVEQERLSMQANYKDFKIFLVNGINTFELEALNRGTLGGNTAEFQIYDDQGILVKSDYWNNWDTGVKGKFVIIKE